MLRISQSPWAACKLGLQMNSSQQQFLNKEKGASVKNSNTEADPVPFALFWSEFYSPPLGPQRAFGDFSKFKKMRFWPTYAFQRFPWISLLFSHGFQHKNFSFTARPLAHRSACQRATPNECRADFSKIRLLCFIKAVKIINSAPLKIPEVSYERFKRISQKVLA